MSDDSESKHRIPPVLLERTREMRHDPVPAEQKLWSCLRNRRLKGLKFKRQHPVGPFIADFFCAEHQLVIELDGESHAGRERYDEGRTRWLNGQGYRVVRFLNDDVHKHLVAVLRTIVREVEDPGPAQDSPSPPWGRGPG